LEQYCEFATFGLIAKLPGRSSKMATREIDTSLSIPKFDLGVLLVHGVGAQPSGDTLVRWGDALLKTIRHASQDKVVVM
jgi:hypothetical protein